MDFVNNVVIEGFVSAIAVSLQYPDCVECRLKESYLRGCAQGRATPRGGRGMKKKQLPKRGRVRLPASDRGITSIIPPPPPAS